MPCVAGLRPNSVDHTNKVSSKSPRCFRSWMSAATGLSIVAAWVSWFSLRFSWPSQLMRGLPKAPPLITCTKRTPRSRSRRAMRQFRPNPLVAGSSMP